jgi:hypothetical protein
MRGNKAAMKTALTMPFVMMGAVFLVISIMYPPAPVKAILFWRIVTGGTLLELVWFWVHWTINQ